MTRDRNLLSQPCAPTRGAGGFCSHYSSPTHSFSLNYFSPIAVLSLTASRKGRNRTTGDEPLCILKRVDGQQLVKAGKFLRAIDAAMRCEAPKVQQAALKLAVWVDGILVPSSSIPLLDYLTKSAWACVRAKIAFVAALAEGKSMQPVISIMSAAGLHEQVESVKGVLQACGGAAGLNFDAKKKIWKAMHPTADLSAITSGSHPPWRRKSHPKTPLKRRESMERARAKRSKLNSRDTAASDSEGYVASE